MVPWLDETWLDGILFIDTCEVSLSSLINWVEFFQLIEGGMKVAVKFFFWVSMGSIEDLLQIH